MLQRNLCQISLSPSSWLSNSPPAYAFPWLLSQSHRFQEHADQVSDENRSEAISVLALGSSSSTVVRSLRSCTCSQSYLVFASFWRPPLLRHWGLSDHRQTKLLRTHLTSCTWGSQRESLQHLLFYQLCQTILFPSTQCHICLPCYGWQSRSSRESPHRAFQIPNCE